MTDSKPSADNGVPENGILPNADPENAAPPEKESAKPEGSPPALPPGVSRVNLSVELPRGARIRVTVEAQPPGSPAAPLQVAPPARALQPQSLPPGERPPTATPASQLPAGQVASKPPALAPGNWDRERGGGGPAIGASLRLAWDKVKMAAAPALTAVRARWRYDLPTTLFALAVIVYLMTRLISLTDFPIYFFTDEAIHTVTAEELVQRDFRDPDQGLLPVYFKNGNYWNLSASVYLQVIPYLIFGKSAFVTRAASALITLLAALGIGLGLRNVFKIPHWWVGPLVLAIAPAWFLHSRTAFETVEFVSFYGMMLYCYLMYRFKSPFYVVPTLLLAGLAFYSYSPGQVVIAITGVGLLLSDILYHFKTFTPFRITRREDSGKFHLETDFDSNWPFYLLFSLITLILIAYPYLRFQSWFRANNPDSAALEHLKNLASYLTDPHQSVIEKLRQYLSFYFYGLSPGYWYVPNETDLPRHLMKSYGNLMMVTLPFAALGLAQALRNIRSSAYRVVLIAMLAAPAGAALVGIGITRTLVFNIPAAILTALGVSAVLEWISDPFGLEHRAGKLAALEPPKLIWWRQIIASCILGIAIIISGRLKLGADKFLVLFVGLYLALAVSQILTWLLVKLQPTRISQWLGKLRLQPTWVMAATFAVVTVMSFSMLRDALVNGPLWYSDYGLGGLQYGAEQVFQQVERYAAANPGAKIIFSPNWANGTDVVARFFLKNPGFMQMGSIEGHMNARKPLDSQTLFVMTPQELEMAASSGKFTNFSVDETLDCPNKQPCFYFVHLAYVENIDEILAAEAEGRRVPDAGQVTINGETVTVAYSKMDMGSIQTLFDEDLRTVGRSYEANPFVITLTFPTAHTFNGITVQIGSIEAKVTTKFFTTPDGPPMEYSFQGRGDVMKPEISMDFSAPVTAQMVQIEILNPNETEPAHIHVWEIMFK